MDNKLKQSIFNLHDHHAKRFSEFKLHQRHRERPRTRQTPATIRRRWKTATISGACCHPGWPAAQAGGAGVSPPVFERMPSMRRLLAKQVESGADRFVPRESAACIKVQPLRHFRRHSRIQKYWVRSAALRDAMFRYIVHRSFADRSRPSVLSVLQPEILVVYNEIKLELKVYFNMLVTDGGTEVQACRRFSRGIQLPQAA